MLDRFLPLDFTKGWDSADRMRTISRIRIYSSTTWSLARGIAHVFLDNLLSSVRIVGG
jgi:hypothetical protein